MFGRNRGELTQKGAAQSTNLQVGRDLTVNRGPSPEQLGAVVREAIRTNAREMQAVAREVFDERIEHFSSLLVDPLAEDEDTELTAAAADPDVMHAVIDAGIGYARVGDDDMAAVLVDLLADRMRAETRSLMALVIDDAVAIAPRLTDGEVAALTIFWLLVKVKQEGTGDLATLARWVRTDIVPLIPHLPRGDASYLHLQSLGCASVQVTTVEFRQPWTDNYPGLFTNGFTRDEVHEGVLPSILAAGALIPSLRDPSRLQVNALDTNTLQATYGEILSDEALTLLNNLLRLTMDDDQVADALAEIDPSMRNLREVWTTTPLRTLSISAVGIAIAHANWRHLTGKNAPLSIWIS